MNETKIIYVVYQENDEWGITIVAAYTDRDKAKEHANWSNRYHYDSVELQ